MQEGSRRAIFAAFLANVGIALAKLLAFFVTGASSMLAEAIHSIADTGNQGLLMFGSHRSKKPPDDRHPFGHGTARYLWAFIVALVLFSVGGLFAIFEGIEKLLHPHTVDSPAWAIGVLLVAAVLESLSLRTARKEARPFLHGQSMLSFIRRTKNPELPVVLLEDSGALIGLFFALVGVVLAAITGNGRYDALGSLAIGLLLVVIASLLATEMSSLIVGESASPSEVTALEDAIRRGPNVTRLIHLRTLHLGPEDVLVAAKVEFDAALTLPALADAIDGTEVEIRRALPAARLVFIEPDVYRGHSARIEGQ
ncbi:MAG TPA: cation diffusion facilitator family transporter [Acidimicrobiia bacterium]